MSVKKQRNIRISAIEYADAQQQATNDGFVNADETPNVTGWLRWLIRKNCTSPEQVQDKTAVT